MRRRNRQDVLVMEILTHQCDVQETLHNNRAEALLSLRDADQLACNINCILQKTTVLAARADKDKQLLWPIKPKSHWLWHLGQRARFLNPRKANCMVDEDFVGACKDIVQASVHGTRPHIVPEKFMSRYRWGEHMVNTYPEDVN